MILTEIEVGGLKLLGVKRFKVNHRYFGHSYEIEFFEKSQLSKQEIREIIEIAGKAMEADEK